MNMHINLICLAVIGLLGHSCAANKPITSSDTSAHYTDIDKKGTYVIDKEIDLHGDKMVLPQCERIVFINGGCIKNGHVVLNISTYSIEGGNGIFENVVIEPNVTTSNDIKCSLPEINARWFGAVGDAKADDTQSLQLAITSAHNLSIPVYIPRGYYLFSKGLSVFEGDYLHGEIMGSITSNNQKGTTYLRYIGKEGSMISVNGNYVTIRDMMIVAKTPHVTDGIELLGKSGSHFNLSNVLVGNVRYGINCILTQSSGLTECIWERVRISNCIRGISVDINSEEKQYITYNNFYNVSISNAQERAVFFHCRSINTCAFRDCLFEHIGYASAFAEDNKFTNIYAIEAINEGNQGSITIDGGYFENIYYSKTGESVKSYDYDNNAVFSIKNMHISVSNARFSNTKTIVKSLGADHVFITNCIDNGYLGEDDNKTSICKPNAKTLLTIDGYTLANKNKSIVNGELNGRTNNVALKNVRLSNGTVVDSSSK